MVDQELDRKAIDWALMPVQTAPWRNTQRLRQVAEDDQHILTNLGIDVADVDERPGRHRHPTITAGTRLRVAHRRCRCPRRR
jgi:hypothetical protein